jgi:hypothetical protein
MGLLSRSAEHLEVAGYGASWTGYRRHSAHAWVRTFQLVRILWWSAMHALIPAWYPFGARTAIIVMAEELKGERRG